MRSRHYKEREGLVEKTESPGSSSGLSETGTIIHFQSDALGAAETTNAVLIPPQVNSF